MTQGFTRRLVDTGTSSSPASSARNLRGSRPSAATVTITADELVLQDAALESKRIVSVNETTDITISGAGGLDTGAEASDTWYAIWIIRKSSDGAVAGLLSLSFSSPTLPAGFDQKALVSVVRNNGGSNFLEFTQLGNSWFYTDWQTMVTGFIGFATWTLINIAGIVPSGISTWPFGSLIAGDQGIGIANINTATIPDLVGSTPTNQYAHIEEQHTNYNSVAWQLEVLTTDTLFWWDVGATTKVISCHGFYLTTLGS